MKKVTLTSAVDVAIASAPSIFAPVSVVDLEQSPVLGSVVVLVRGRRVHGALRLNEADPVGQSRLFCRLAVESFV